MKTKLLNLWRSCVQRLPEALLLFFLLSLAPMVIMGVGALWGGIKKVGVNPLTFTQHVQQDPWPTAATVVFLVGLAGLVVVVWRTWQRTWAVARKMILEAFHRKVVLVLLVFLLVLMPSLPFVLKTEGALKSQVQIVLLYSLVLSMVLI